MHFKLNHVGDWSYYSWPELDEKGIIHGFFTRDNPGGGLQNGEGKRFLKAFGLRDLVAMGQTHSADVHIVENGERPSQGDGIILLEQNIAAIVRTADCLPVIICEPHYPLVAIIHSGWRGTAKGIVGRAVAMMGRLGAKKSRMIALMGPSIGSCCYEVKDDVLSVFRRQGFPAGVFIERRGRFFLDLKKANREIMCREGVNTIHDLRLCTLCRKDLFYSYRGGEKKGRQISFVSLR